jgi:hypothetical protein
MLPVPKGCDRFREPGLFFSEANNASLLEFYGEGFQRRGEGS